MNLFAAIRREYIYITTIARTLWKLRTIKPGATTARTIVDVVEEFGRKTPSCASDAFITNEVMSYGRTGGAAPSNMPIGRCRWA